MSALSVRHPGCCMGTQRWSIQEQCCCSLSAKRFAKALHASMPCLMKAGVPGRGGLCQHVYRSRCTSGQLAKCPKTCASAHPEIFGEPALTRHQLHGQGKVPVGDVEGRAVLCLLQDAVHSLQSAHFSHGCRSCKRPPGMVAPRLQRGAWLALADAQDNQLVRKERPSAESAVPSVALSAPLSRLHIFQKLKKCSN